MAIVMGATSIRVVFGTAPQGVQQKGARGNERTALAVHPGPLIMRPLHFALEAITTFASGRGAFQELVYPCDRQGPSVAPRAVS